MPKCKTCINMHNHWCEKIVDSPHEDDERECEHYKCMTNGDRIRKMEDAELTDIILCPYDTAGEPIEIMPCVKDGNAQEVVPPEDCKKCMMEWLGKEVEE